MYVCVKLSCFAVQQRSTHCTRATFQFKKSIHETRTKTFRSCQSLCNTPILPIQKSSREYQFVQDLGAVSEAVIPVHPLVSNPFTLLTQCQEHPVFLCFEPQRCIFSCNHLHPDSQWHFAFEWKSPDTLKDTQYTWQNFCRVLGTAPICLEMH